MVNPHQATHSGMRANPRRVDSAHAKFLTEGFLIGLNLIKDRKWSHSGVTAESR